MEEKKERAEHLQKIVGIEKEALPTNFHCQVINEKFETALRETLDYLDEENLSIAPTFAFIDPFGIKGLPFSLIKRLLENDKCEVLITFVDSTMSYN